MKKLTLISAIILMAISISAQPINVPADQPSVQAAIEKASDGDTVLVEEGRYFENINFMGKPITVASRLSLMAIRHTFLKPSLTGVRQPILILPPQYL